MDERQRPGERPGNEVHLCGRLSGEPEEREMPSGDRMWTFRIVVPREQPRGRQTVDVLDCAAWAGRVRRTVARWSDGDEVEIGGELRRRFFRSGGSTASRVEVEVTSARLTRRAASA